MYILYCIAMYLFSHSQYYIYVNMLPILSCACWVCIEHQIDVIILSRLPIRSVMAPLETMILFVYYVRPVRNFLSVSVCIVLNHCCL